MTDDYIDTPFGKVKVVSDEVAEESDWVVCGPPSCSLFPDDIHTVCFLCNTPIIHRPHMPKKPRKICLSCMMIELEKEKADGHE